MIMATGSMGQFVALSVKERKELLDTWVVEGHKQGLYIIQHVGCNILADAIDLGKRDLPFFASDSLSLSFS